MAEANIRLHNARLEQEQQGSINLESGFLAGSNFSFKDKTVSSSDAGRQCDNKLSSHLHENLDFYQLFNTFINELRTTVPCDSIEYENQEAQSFLVNGFSGRHHCEYTLKHEDLSLGVIRITRDSKLTNHELDIIETMLAGLTLPLRNALRHQQAIRLAQRDELTGLRNGSYYHDIVDLEIKRSRRYKNPFSLLMLDLDNFDNINTQYGRQAGDAILREVANRITEKARNSDIVYRVGGDKFLVFLPNTDKAEAEIAATRIKDFVLSRACTLTDEREDKLISFTLSVGVVTVTQSDTVEKLIDRVDKAMFHAKMLGKDRIYADSFTSSTHTG